MRKTVLEHLNDLEEPYRTQAIENAKIQNEANLELFVDSKRESISEAFIWSHSKEGYRYWNKYRNGIGKQIKKSKKPRITTEPKTIPEYEAKIKELQSNIESRQKQADTIYQLNEVDKKHIALINDLIEKFKLVEEICRPNEEN
jgi:uridine kinase